MCSFVVSHVINRDGGLYQHYNIYLRLYNNSVIKTFICGIPFVCIVPVSWQLYTRNAYVAMWWSFNARFISGKNTTFSRRRSWFICRFIVLFSGVIRDVIRVYLNAAGMFTTRFMTRLTGKSIGKTRPPTATWSMRFSPTPGEWWITGTLTLFRCSSGPTPATRKIENIKKHRKLKLGRSRVSFPPPPHGHVIADRPA